MSTRSGPIGGSALHSRIIALLASVALLVGALAGPAAAAEPKVALWLTILHNNDGESQVLDAGPGLEDFGGAARFKTVVDELRWDATNGPWPQRGAKRGVVMISSGDNFLAGPEFNVGLEHGVPFYDTIAMELIGYDAVNLGNHDFDFGPDVLADFIDGYAVPPTYVSANLDFSGEPRLQAYVDAGVIMPATVIRERGELIGVIGLETPNLPFISSPRNVEVSDDLAAIVQAQVDHLQGMGVEMIILSSHLQSIENEVDLAGMVDGLDVIIAGGGDELLADGDDLLIPGDEGSVYGSYPMMATDMDGDMVPVVTTSGEYKYVGQLVVGFDQDGQVLMIEQDRSGPVRVASGDCSGTMPCDDAVLPDPTMQAMVVDPVAAGLEELAATVVATSEVDLDGRRAAGDAGVRVAETNEGDLIADSLLWQATEVAPDYGVDAPQVALQNGGGIRNNNIIPAGPLTELDTFSMVPFPNFVAIVEDVPREQFKEILENAYSRVEFVDGRFAQIAGFAVQYDPTGTPQLLDLDGNVTQAGDRVREVQLDDGTVIVTGGAVVPGDPIDVATIDFLARGGDQYPFRGLPFEVVGFTYQQALAAFLEAGLGGVVSAADYPFGGEGRIVRL